MSRAPSNYSETIAVIKRGAAGPTVTFALTAGSLPARPDLCRHQPVFSTAITGNPTKTGALNFTIKATDANLTSTQAYQITITRGGSAGPVGVRAGRQRRAPGERDLHAA